ncbi:hypothetical protein [Paenibacillus thalictri]|uniref:DUF927 domain-containing protein n=1 Tax=Paenibacillus thalictri TaxID=2527873 RepID=A0A4Q9DV22_9BACL|nr:hypothetical protein [Paenibacillus thalictri]TBL80877.1 hypothetical protein EYB31_06575 [Paenibacillus thalictri]
MTANTASLSSILRGVADSVKNGQQFEAALIEPLNKFLASESLRTNFLIKEDGSVSVIRRTKEFKLSNTFVLPIGDKIIHHPDHDERYLKVICLMKGAWHAPIYLSPSQLRNDQDWVRKSLGFKSVIWGSYSYVVEYVNTLCALVPTVHEYAYIGWSKTHTGIYITGSGVIGDSGTLDIAAHPSIQKFELPKPEITKYTALKTVIETFLELGSHGFTFTALSYMLLGCYKSLLEQLPFSPEFVYYIYGTTGSRKTASSKVFFNTFNDWERVPVNFTATAPAIELQRMLRRDTVLLIDDIPPTVSLQERNVIQSKLEAIFRSTGDSTGRQKMVSPNHSMEMKAQGLAAVTAEDVYVKSASSLARGFFVKMDSNTVRLDKLSLAQRLHNHYSAMIYHFIEYISKDVNSFVTRVADLYKTYEHFFSRHHETAHGRQIASAAWLQTSFEIFLEFALAHEVLEEDEMTELLQENEDILHDKVAEMVKHSHANGEVELFVRAIKELLASGSLLLSDIKLIDRSKTADLPPSHPKALGYRDSAFIYLLSDSVYNRVCAHYAKQNKTFPVTQEMLWSSLQDKKLLVPDRNKDGTRTVRLTVNGDRIPVIRLNREVYECWGEHPYDVDARFLPGSLAGMLNFR